MSPLASVATQVEPQYLADHPLVFAPVASVWGHIQRGAQTDARAGA